MVPQEAHILLFSERSITDEPKAGAGLFKQRIISKDICETEYFYFLNTCLHTAVNFTASFMWSFALWPIGGAPLLLDVTRYCIS